MTKIFNRILNYLIIASILFLIGKSAYNQYVEMQKLSQPKYELTLSLEDAKVHFPEADSIVKDDISSYLVLDEGNVIGEVVNTSPYSDDIYGYNSITPLTIYIDSNDIIKEVEICPNKESRGFINKVINSGYLDSWDGLSIEDALNHEVDAVSGCTYTSTAISESLQACMEELTSQEAERTWDWNLFAKQICVLVVTVLALICFFNPKKSKKLRIITLSLSILILGFWTNSLLSLALFYNWLTNGISLTMQVAVIVIAAVSIILPLFTKKSFYCQYLCPFGAVQEFVGMIPVKKVTISSKIYNAFAIIRRLILLALLVLLASGVGLDLSMTEPFSIFSYQTIIFEVALLTAIIVVASIFIKKPWCNYLCPTGTLLKSISR
jgi:hypothetical protein